MKQEKTATQLSRYLLAICLIISFASASVQMQVASNPPYVLEQSVIAAGGTSSGGV